MTPPTVLNFRSWGHRMERALTDQTLEARLLGALLAADLGKGMLSAGLWIHTNDSMISKVVRLSAFPEIVAAVWMLLAALVLPYFLMQVFGWGLDLKRSITRLACRAILASGVLWGFLAFLSRNIDTPNLTLSFVLNSFACVLMSGILATSINAAMQLEEPRKEGCA